MLNLHTYCKIKIVTDCNSPDIEDMNEESNITLKKLKDLYEDIKDDSRIILSKKRMTAVDGDRLLSILIIDNNIQWKDFV